MPRPRKTPLQPLEGQGPLEPRLRALAERLRGGYLRALEQLGLLDKGTQDLARSLALTPVVCSRVRAALAHEDPLTTLFHFPGLEPQRNFVEAIHDKGCEDALALDLVAAQEELRQIIALECGDLRALQGFLAQWVPGALAAQFPGQRQALHRSMQETEGLELQAASYTACFLPQQSGEIRIVHVFTALGITRWSGEAEFSVEFERSSLDQVEGLDGRSIAEGGIEPLRQDAFCTRAPARFSPDPGERVQYVLEPTSLGPGGAVDLCMVQVESELRPTLPLDPGRTRGPSFIPNYPTERVLLEALVPRRGWYEGAPQHLAVETLTRGDVGAVGDPGIAGSLRSVLEPVERLPLERGALRVPDLPMHGELLVHTVRTLGADPADFEVWRLELQRPVPWIQTFLAWAHPETPETCLRPAREVYL